MDHYDTLRDLGTPAVLALAEAVTVMDPDAGHHTAWERHLHALTAPSQRSRPEQPTDVIDALLRYRDSDGRWLPGPTIASLALDILAVGWETTTGLLAHSLELGLTDRTRWQQFTDLDHAAAHVEECLRLHPPIAGRLRHTRTPVTLDGITIPEGARCLLLIGAANHDPRRFPDPDRYDPHRPNAAAHLAFGAGWHSCVGADLARLEAVTLLRELATRMPRLRLTDGYQRRYYPSIALLSHETLPALVDSRCPHPDA
jgi:cytochrome P450